MRRIAFVLVMFLLVQGCVPAQTVDGGPQTVSEATQTTVQPPPPAVTNTPLPTGTPAPVILESSPTPQPFVRITAEGGNIFIRRGPGTQYNQIGILYDGMSADVIAQDVLSRWVQVSVPGSEATGWVSVQTRFASVQGDLKSLPNFTFTEWFLPAFVVNCTEHDLVLEPGGIDLYNLFTHSQSLNEQQVDPGLYTVHDLYLPGAPEIQKINVKEGMTVYITVNGLGNFHFCP
ncbi:MAG TPA: SH3 domain-containing protein [Anaerolineales bacterium]|nr:SH3 domain-containing protein [Anaerolineales bacterium]